MIDLKRLAEICKLRQEASYGYATANGQVYARDVNELLNDRNDLLAEMERQRARADLAEHTAEQLRSVIKHMTDGEVAKEKESFERKFAEVEQRIAQGPRRTGDQIDSDVLEGGD